MKPKERQEARREERLARIRQQVESGELVIRQMTRAEKRAGVVTPKMKPGVRRRRKKTVM